ncbi:cell division protein FtsQ/DivIB, partial [uncultured Ruminococcus sp.]|uniref:cell division protein FtsQ/DivIB n=1 Tax=uncultured Ruminococcus sp. TaxID=165186 RepID=UPI0025E8ECFB
MNGTYKENRMTSQRPAARQRTVNKRNIYVASFFAAAALLLIMSMFLFFNVSDIKIEGVTLYEQDQILGVGGVSTGQNLVRTNTDIVEKRLKDTLVYIDDVKVTKKFPSTIVISCTEAKKAADIEYKNSYYVLSESGKILETKNPDPTGEIPVVKGFELKSLSQGDKLASEDSFKADILEELLKDLNNLGFENIDTIDLTTRSDIKLMYDGRLEIKMGSSVDMEYKLTYLKAVIDESITADYEGTLIYNGADSGISAIPKSQDESSVPDTSSSADDDSSSAVSADTSMGDGNTWNGNDTNDTNDTWNNGDTWTGDDTQGYGDNTGGNTDTADNNGGTYDNGTADWGYDNGYTDNGYADNGYGDDQGYTCLLYTSDAADELDGV